MRHLLQRKILSLILNNKNRLAISILVSLVFTSCASPAPSADMVATAIAQTQAAQPTPTAIPTDTPIPLTDIDLESILLLPGDLPAEFTGGQIKKGVPEMLQRHFQDLPPAEQTIHLEIREGIYASDGVFIFLYDSEAVRDEAYSFIAKLIGDHESTVESEREFYETSEAGEKGVVLELASSLFTSPQNARIAFTRCHAGVYISLFSPLASGERILTYAQRLDERIEPLACR